MSEMTASGQPARVDGSGHGYSGWSERRWRDPCFVWDPSVPMSAGIDVGAVSSQAVLIGNEQVRAYASLRTGFSSRGSAERALSALLETAGISIASIQYLVGTGYGKANVPQASRKISEILCHARGVNYLAGPEVRTILDMGGQDCKVIRCDDKGHVEEFLMNDKCAAGTGRGMEVFAEYLGVGLEELSEMSMNAKDNAPSISATCAIFAKSEALMLLHEGWGLVEVAAAYCQAVAERVALLIGRVGLKGELFVSGGVAKNRGVVTRLERILGINSAKLPPSSPLDPQIAGALGAAIYASECLGAQLNGDE